MTLTSLYYFTIELALQLGDIMLIDSESDQHLRHVSQPCANTSIGDLIMAVAQAHVYV